MRAVLFERFGGPEVLTLAEVDEPHAGPGQVRIRTVAASVNPIDITLREGPMPGRTPLSLPAVPGMEAAGLVDEVGEGVVGVAIGDEAFGHTAGRGGYAQYTVLVDPAVKPPEVSWETAAALPVAVETADRVLGTLELNRGETLLVHGAAGVSASVGVQIAVGRGVIVVGTASPGNHDYIRSLGAIPVAYGSGWGERVRAAAPGGVHAVWDAAGAGVLEESVALLGGHSDRVVSTADLSAPSLGAVLSTGARRNFGPELADYARRFASGDLTLRIDRVLAMDDVVRAQEIVGSGHARGKVILQPR